MPFLTRLFSPAAYGEFASYFAVLGFFLVVGACRYDFAISMARDEKEADALLAISLLIITAIALLTLLWQVGYYGLQPLGLWSLLPAAALLGGCLQAFTYRLIRQKRFKDLAANRVLQASGTAGLQLSGGLIHPAPLSLALADVGARLAAVYVVVRRRPRLQWHSVRFETVKGALAAYRGLAFYSTNAAVLNQLGLLLPILCMGAFYGPEAAGWFALMMRVINVPQELIAQSAGTVLLAEAGALRGQPAELRRRYLTKTTRLGAVGVLMALVLFFLGESLFAWVFGGRWQSSGTFAAAFALGFFARFTVASTNSILTVLQGSRVQLVIDAARAAAIPVAFFLSWLVSAEPAVAVFALSVVMSLSYMAYFAAILWKTRTGTGVEPPGPGPAGGRVQ